MDLTLREGVDLQSAIQIAREIDQQSKQAGFNQEALDQMARKGFANAKFEMDVEDGLDVVDEFYQGGDKVKQVKVGDTDNIKNILEKSFQTVS